ncbi:Gfo/Idh/MocA family protein [Okeania sp. SIO2B3]|uniref:Gfo/Idh/MocA family protein n=1 Tax=Okeania sp. SIO2B3 TaxID=2607784 RepID=UPI0013BEE116|nr:Gfo/Idh/MocA family oxidoreductase [Okeania sp. SIO2B3]NET40485.1 Gfo/Idh/MocA family oxidoreductase [Okeania sp. SIO2B3]
MTDTLRFGIVGTGLIAKVIAQGLVDAKNCALVGVASRSISRAQEFGQQFGDVKGFDSWQDLIAWSGVDAIYIGTPTALKEEIAVVAAQQKKHVLVDKPFATLESLQKITVACRENQVLFMDATHFVHHPRIATIKQTMEENIGKVQAIRSAFYFPVSDRSNIRFNPELEPTGALGDLGWYNMRATVEFLAPNINLSQTSVKVKRDTETGAIVRCCGMLAFDDDSTSTWDAGYTSGAITMDLALIGTKGIITLDDFVLDWVNSFAFENPNLKAGFYLKNGMDTRGDVKFIEVKSEQSSQVKMIENFADVVFNGVTNSTINYCQVSEKTQTLLDAIYGCI